jgi:hypothetical protein
MPRKAQAAGAATVMPYTLQTLAVRGIRVLDEVQPRSYLDDQVIKE